MTNSAPATLEGRSIIITGAASGIGRATAEVFAAHGAQLGLMDVSGPALSEVAAALGAKWEQCDLGDAAAVTKAVDSLGNQLGRIDGVINCAGITIPGQVEDLDEEKWNRVIDINLTAPFRVCRAALPWLRKEPSATIVNVASAQGLVPNLPGISSYAASKAGLIGLTKALAVEFAPTIRVNAICPGLTKTPGASDVPAEVAAKYALKRVADPEEMASAMLFLTSAQSAFITGVALAVDGGRTYH